MRIYVVLLLIFIMGAAIVGRLFSLQVVSGEHYKELAGRQHKIAQDLKSERGSIFIHDKSELFPAAITRQWPMVYLAPKNIRDEDKNKIVQELSVILGLEENTISQKVSRSNDPYEPLAHQLNDFQVEQIKELNISGIEIVSEDLRYYPLGNTLSHVLGFVGFKNDKKIGQYGVEEFYDKELQGEVGQIITEKDALGRIIGIAERFIRKPATPSRDLILTIDKNIQFMAEEKLDGLIKKWKADSGSVIVMNPSDGAVIAMANYPNFDLNNYSKTEDINVFSNPAIHSVFEPGSVFKPITMAAAVDDYKVTPETLYFDDGFVKIGGYIIRNSDNKSHEWQTMTQVLEKSLNTGAIFVQRLLDNDTFVDYIRKFGFDKKTNIDLAGEVVGNINNLHFGREINYATASFGQGIAVTSIQLLSAISAIANQGVLMQPRVAQATRDSEGKVIEFQPKRIERVMSSENARKLTSMLVSAVENGYDKKTRIPGYYIAGKTGTAQVPLKEERGYGDETIHTFIGYAPAYNPRFITLIKIDNPKGIRFASDSIGPTFRQLTEFMLNYYGIPPDYNIIK